MKTIEEIMGLVDSFANACEHEFFADMHGEVAPTSALRVRESIEAALRELVERKPLSDEDVFNIYCNSDSTLNTTSVNLVLFARAIERAHGIGA